jgi:hypothetical protein
MVDTTHTTADSFASRVHVHALAVYDGQTRLGYLVHCDGGFEAFDIDGTSYGTFPDMRSAAFALPARGAS